tara:strand:- start:892 stop:1386 length:495 start_codon:yes stop_codon:yes gene_type:complete
MADSLHQLGQDFMYRRWDEFISNTPTPKGLVYFHTIHKCILMAYNQLNQVKLGRIVALSGTRVQSDLLNDYQDLLNKTMRFDETSKKHANVLYHLMGYLKDFLDTSQKTYLIDSIEEYRVGLTSINKPVGLFNRFIWEFPVQDWIRKQEYLKLYSNDIRKFTRS